MCSFEAWGLQAEQDTEMAQDVGADPEASDMHGILCIAGLHDLRDGMAVYR